MGPDHEHGISGSGYIQHGVASQKFNFICNFIFTMLSFLRQEMSIGNGKNPVPAVLLSAGLVFFIKI
jgi:hypothetical protein